MEQHAATTMVVMIPVLGDRRSTIHPKSDDPRRTPEARTEAAVAMLVMIAVPIILVLL